MNAVVTLTNNCPQGLSHILLRLGHKLSPSTTPSNPPAISLLSTPDVRALLNVTRCIPFHSSTSSLPYTTSRSEVGLPGTTGIQLHCTFCYLEGHARCVPSEPRGGDDFWGARVCSGMLHLFWDTNTHTIFNAYLVSFYILSTTISCHLTFGRQRLMLFVEEGDIYNDVISVLEDSFATTSVNVCM